jgi:hypothetical protein
MPFHSRYRKEVQSCIGWSSSELPTLHSVVMWLYDAQIPELEIDDAVQKSRLVGGICGSLGSNEPLEVR